MGRLIDEDAAIDAIEKTYGMISYHEDGFTRSDAIDIIKALPSAQPEQKWILCRERLPEKREMVIIWIDMPKQPFVQQSIHMAFAWLEPDARTGELHWMDRHFTKIDDSKVIAWMPVPERYQPQPNEVPT